MAVQRGAEEAHHPYAEDGEYEKQLFHRLIKPDDSYTADGTYWAELPMLQRASFVAGTDIQEACTELGAIGSMIRRNPLSPIAWYLHNAVLPGAGLGLEGYVLFSIGNLLPLFKAAWPTCWDSSSPDSVCSPRWIAAVSYLEVVGIIVGQIIVGILGDWFGRRLGLVQDAVVMFLGLLMLTASWGTTLNGWVICYAWSLFFYGFGVGGEYPMTATAAMENSTAAGLISAREDRLHRGRKVTLAFLMQGWGQLINQIVLVLLLLIFSRGNGDGPYEAVVAQYVFRISFAVAAVGTLWLVYHRAYQMPLASHQLKIAKRAINVTGYDTKSLRLTFTHFGSRLFATSGTWFCNDFFFYGNKLFQSEFISVISHGSTSIMEGWEWNLANIAVSLAGYHLASLLVDNKFYGRKYMMQVGFLMDFIFFIIPAFHYEYCTSSAGIRIFQAMYFLSSFFNQFGPNSVTFLVAAECFPTPVRATAHGISAAVGKLGAVAASITYSYIDPQKKFLAVSWFGLAGMLITFFFLPDTTGLDLAEQERRWKHIRVGSGHEYHGVAIHSVHLSVWERWRGVGKSYDPKRDDKAKIQELRAIWEVRQTEKSGEDSAGKISDDDDFTEEMRTYFAGMPQTTHVEERSSMSGKSIGLPNLTRADTV